MKFITKLTCLTLCATVLSSCAFTHDVLQSFYDDEADKNCRASSCDHIQARRDREYKKQTERWAKANAKQAKAKKAGEKYISNLNAAEALRNAENLKNPGE